MVITILSLGGKGNSEYRRDIHKKLKCFFMIQQITATADVRDNKENGQHDNS
jgi:hypothetical protein